MLNLKKRREIKGGVKTAGNGAGIMQQTGQFGNQCGGSSSRRPVWGFVMMEVLIALVILGLSLTAFLHSFTQSLSTAKTLEIQTQAMFFAKQLMDEFEIVPPHYGTHEGGFGDDYAAFSWKLDLELDDEPNYDDVGSAEDFIDQYFTMRIYHIEIHYDDGDHKSFKAFETDSAIIGFEKFSRESKKSYGNF
jgi:type II secretory pathway pseudopilin PulG